MSIPAQFLSDASAMPRVLRELLEAELAAGNEICEVFHSFPSPPVGACFLLARHVTTRPRASGDGVEFYDRNSSSYSGEFTDAQRFFFILEPPHPPPPEPEPDAIRATGLAQATLEPAAAETEDAVRRFVQSMAMDYEMWHDGTGYDLEIIRNATPEGRARIEALLAARGVRDARDVEALAAIDSPRARGLLAEALRAGDPAIQAAVLRCAPGAVSHGERLAALVSQIAGAEVYGGLTQALLEVEEFHPPEVIDALFRGVLARSGAIAGDFAALLMYLHGKAESAFDWELRPFFLQFQEGDRETLFRELCAKVEVDPDQYLKR